MTKNKGKIISILTSYTVGTPPNSISNYVSAKYSLLITLVCFLLQIQHDVISIQIINH